MIFKEIKYSIQTFFKRFEVENCPVCALYPINLVPYLPVKAYCPHSYLNRYHSKSAHFKVEKFNQLVNLSISALMLILNLFNIHLMYQKCGKVKEMCFLHLFDFFYGLSGILMCQFATIPVKLHVQYFNGWILTIKNYKKYGFPVLITPRNCRDILVQSAYCYSILAIFPPILIGGWFFPHEEFDYFLIRVAPTAFSGFIQIVLIILYTQVAFFEHKIACNTRDHIVELMTKKALNCVNQDITENLKLLTNFFQFRQRNFKSFFALVYPLMSIWILFSIICLVTNFYLMIDQWHNIDHYFVASIYLKIRSYIVVCSLVYMMSIVGLYDKVSEKFIYV